MLRIFAVTSLALLGMSPTPSGAISRAVPVKVAAPIARTAFRAGPSAQDTMNESIARMTMQAATPGADATSLSQRDRLALLVLLALHHDPGATGH